MNGDPEAISNHSLHAKLMTLEAKFEAHGRQLDDHVGQASEFRRETGETLRAIDSRLGKGETRFALVEQGIAGNTATLGKIDTKLDTLIAEENQRKGREGVLAAILSSKAFGWLAAFVAAVGAFFAGSNQGGS